jgi:hypothetical protein
MRWDAGAGVVPRVGVYASSARGMLYVQGRDQRAVHGEMYNSRTNPQKELIIMPDLCDASAKCPRMGSFLIRSSSEPPEMKPTYFES